MTLSTASFIAVALVNISLSSLPQVAEASSRDNAAHPTIGTQTSQASSVVLADRTKIHLRLTHTVSSKTAQPGARVEFEVVDDVELEGQLVVARGALATGHVAAIVPERGRGQGGTLDIEVGFTNDILGQNIRLRGVMGERGRSISFFEFVDPRAALFTPVMCLVYLFSPGKGAVLTSGKGITAYVEGYYAYEADNLRAASLRFKAERNRGPARVYFYDQRSGIYGKTRISIDGIEVARLPPRSVVPCAVEPGLHSFLAGKLAIKISIQGGEEYFIQLDPQLGGLIAMPAEVGMYDVSGLKFVQPYTKVIAR